MSRWVAGGGGGLSDTDLAALVQDDASATAGALRAAFRRVETVDLGHFLLPGEQLPNDGALDAAPLIRRVADAGVLARVPPGRYRLLSRIFWKSGAGLIGAGRHNTTFAPEGTAVLAASESMTYAGTIDDCVFVDFTVDCRAQASTGSDTGTKAFAVRFLNRARFERITSIGSWATAFGCDFMQDSTFVDCVSTGSGRGMTGSRWGVGAGFGIGVGDFATESVTLINCLALDGYSGGFFFERLVELDWPNDARGVTLIGCAARGHHVGLQDAGAHGLLAVGCHFTDNELAGVALRGSSPILGPRHGGKDGRVADSVILRNGGLPGSAGVLLAYAGNGGYTFENNEVTANTGPGVWAPTTSLLGPGHHIRGNRIARNTGPGVLVQAPVIDRIEVAGNTITGNSTDPAITPRGGVLLTADTIEPKITDNVIVGHYGPGVGLLTAAAISATPTIRRNTLTENTGGGVVNEQVTGDSTGIADNRTTAAVATITNLMTNPSAEVDAAGYVVFSNVSSPARTAGGGKFGDHFIRATATAAGSPAMLRCPPVSGVVAGEVYTFSAWVRLPLNRIVKPRLRLYGSSNLDREGGGYRTSGDWQRISFTVVIPPTVTRADLIIISETAESEAGDPIDVDGVFVTKGTSLWDYFDGSMPGCAWTGTAHASTSTKTV